MNDLERIREFLPFAVAFYLALSVAQLQAKQPAYQAPRNPITYESFVSGLKWHLNEMAKNEQYEMLAYFPGN